MKDSGRLAAAIEILTDFETRRVPLKTAIADWARNARFAGAKDRAWISGLCLDALRRKNSLSVLMGSDAPRALALGAFRFSWGAAPEEIAEHAADEPHGPGALSAEELSAFAGDRAIVAAAHVAGDFPEWLTRHMRRAFGERTILEGAKLAARADVDLRVNTLKSGRDKALGALKTVGAEAIPVLTTSIRIPAPPANARAPSVTVIPAFNKGWVEVQDLGSQIAATAAGDIKSKQVLDYCAGGGGKTLALAALMANTGQLYAYDKDAQRLKSLYERARRAGVRNIQIRNPAGGDTLDDLAGKMDVVFIDAPCSGSGTWRRHPDTKWRLTPQQLDERIAEQDAVLREGAAFVKPGGRLVYVTCSVFHEENEDRLDAFRAAHPDFAVTPAVEAVAESGLLAGRAALEACATPEGSLRMSPGRIRADGFFVATLKRNG